MARIGHRMQSAVDYVAAHPGCPIIDVARAITPLQDRPYGNWAYGYNPVHRAIHAGILDAVRLASGRYSLTVPGHYSDGPSDAPLSDEDRMTLRERRDR